MSLSHYSYASFLTTPSPQGIDYFTVANCIVSTPGSKLGVTPAPTLAHSIGECISEHGKSACEDAGGKCVMQTDGYYHMSVICVVVAVILLVTFIRPTAMKLQSECHCFFFLSLSFLTLNMVTDSPGFLILRSSSVEVESTSGVKAAGTGLFDHWNRRVETSRQYYF